MLSQETIEKRLKQKIKIGTEVHTLGEWLANIGINYHGYRARLSRGMTIDEALTVPRGKILEHMLEQQKPQPKAKHVEYKFIRNGGGAGTWKWVEVDE